MNENLQSKGFKGAESNLVYCLLYCGSVPHLHRWDTSISLVQQRVFHVFAMVLIYFLMQTQQAGRR